MRSETVSMAGRCWRDCGVSTAPPDAGNMTCVPWPSPPHHARPNNVHTVIGCDVTVQARGVHLPENGRVKLSGGMHDGYAQRHTQELPKKIQGGARS